MPDTPTTRLNLYKSASDGSEDVDYTQDIGDNWDAVDLAVGALAVTTSTFPSTPWNGQIIRDTSTSRLWVSNGSTPASGSWSEICTPGTAQTFTAGATFSGANVLYTRAGATNPAFRTMVGGDANDRMSVDASGKHTWGSGAAATDTNLYRNAAGSLTTDGALAVGGNLTVTGTGQVLFARKTADTGRTSTTQTSDPHLTMTVAAGAIYEMIGTLYLNTTDTTNADFTLGFTSPASTGGFWSAIGQPTSATADNTGARTIISALTSTRAFGALSTDNLPVLITGIVRPPTAGTFALQWSRVGSSGTATMTTDSYLKLTRVG